MLWRSKEQFVVCDLLHAYRDAVQVTRSHCVARWRVDDATANCETFPRWVEFSEVVIHNGALHLTTQVLTLTSKYGSDEPRKCVLSDGHPSIGPALLIRPICA